MSPFICFTDLKNNTKALFPFDKITHIFYDPEAEIEYIYTTSGQQYIRSGASSTIKFPKNFEFVFIENTIITLNLELVEGLIAGLENRNLTVELVVKIDGNMEKCIRADFPTLEERSRFVDAFETATYTPY